MDHTRELTYTLWILFVIAYGLPGLMVILAIPMVSGKVPPNHFYRFRTPRTVSSPDVWYPANYASGWLMIAAAVCTIAINTMLLTMLEWQPRRLILLTSVTVTVPLLLSLAASFVYLRRLP